MSAFEFPNPVDQQTVVNPVTGTTYQWKEPPGKWVVTTKANATGSLIWEGPNPPIPVEDYRFWFDTVGLELYFYHCYAVDDCEWLQISTPIQNISDLEAAVTQLQQDVGILKQEVSENTLRIDNRIYYGATAPDLLPDEQYPQFDANGDPVLDANGDQVILVERNKLNYTFWFDTTNDILHVLAEAGSSDDYVEVSSNTIWFDDDPPPADQGYLMWYHTSNLDLSVFYGGFWWPAVSAKSQGTTFEVPTIQQVLNAGHVTDLDLTLTNGTTDAIDLSPTRNAITIASKEDDDELLPRLTLLHIEGDEETTRADIQLNENGKTLDIDCEGEVDDIRFRFEDEVKLQLNRVGDAEFFGKVKGIAATEGSELTTLDQVQAHVAEIVAGIQIPEIPTNLVTLDEDQVITGNKDYMGVIDNDKSLVNRQYVDSAVGSIVIPEVPELPDNLVTTDETQEITSRKYFADGVDIVGRSTFTGVVDGDNSLINKEYVDDAIAGIVIPEIPEIPELPTNLVTLNEAQTITGDKEYTGSINSDNALVNRLYVDNAVGSIVIPEIPEIPELPTNLVTLDEEQTITGDKEYTGAISADNALVNKEYVDTAISSIEIPEVPELPTNLVTIDEDQTITGSKTFTTAVSILAESTFSGNISQDTSLVNRGYVDNAISSIDPDNIVYYTEAGAITAPDACNVGGQVYSGLGTGYGLLRSYRAADPSGNAFVIDSAPGVQSVTITGDGRAFFAGSVNVGEYSGSDATKTGARVSSAGVVFAKPATGNTTDLFRGYEGNNLLFKVDSQGAVTTPQIKFADGTTQTTAATSGGPTVMYGDVSANGTVRAKSDTIQYVLKQGDGKYKVGFSSALPNQFYAAIATITDSGEATTTAQCQIESKAADSFVILTMREGGNSITREDKDFSFVVYA